MTAFDDFHLRTVAPDDTVIKKNHHDLTMELVKTYMLGSLLRTGAIDR
jgi:hypothetical protein